MIAGDDVVLSEPLAGYGVDSLVAVELGSMLALRAGAELSIFDIMQSWSISDVLRGWWEGVGLLVSLFWRGGEEVGGELRRGRWRLVHWLWHWR